MNFFADFVSIAKKITKDAKTQTTFDIFHELKVSEIKITLSS